ncbi:hypothetical protein Bpla01_08560 [Burkholderia plantarii]|nr:hypothetical protein Bpla01_08560 [Burkholderia plantarii]
MTAPNDAARACRSDFKLRAAGATSHFRLRRRIGQRPRDGAIRQAAPRSRSTRARGVPSSFIGTAMPPASRTDGFEHAVQNARNLTPVLERDIGCDIGHDIGGGQRRAP